MPRQIVQCEVTWVVNVGFSGNELPPSTWNSFGHFDSEVDAQDALLGAGFTRCPGTWRATSRWHWQDSTGYGTAYVSRVLTEIKPETQGG